MSFCVIVYGMMLALMLDIASAEDTSGKGVVIVTVASVLRFG